VAGHQQRHDLEAGPLKTSLPRVVLSTNDPPPLRSKLAESKQIKAEEKWRYRSKTV
jgi:hypothetical protein